MDMKYHMVNRPNREIIDAESIKNILINGKYITLSLCRDNEPYIVTLSYGYDTSENAIYMHCAKKGLKLDFINDNPNVCGTIIEDGGYIYNECGHWYKSLIIRGKIVILEDPKDMSKGLEVILNHLEKDSDYITEKMTDGVKPYNNLVVLKLEINEINGKSGR